MAKKNKKMFTARHFIGYDDGACYNTTGYSVAGHSTNRSPWRAAQQARKNALKQLEITAKNFRAEGYTLSDNLVLDDTYVREL